MENVVLYSTGCPKCNVLKAKLKSAGVRYEEVNDVDVMLSQGYTSAPTLSVEGVDMDFSTAIEWINNRSK